MDVKYKDRDVCSLKKDPLDQLEEWGGVMGTCSDRGVCEASGDMTI